VKKYDLEHFLAGVQLMIGSASAAATWSTASGTFQTGPAIVECATFDLLLPALSCKMAVSSEAEEAADVFIRLFSEWYGVPPHWRRLAEVKGQAFEHLWTNLWFAKGNLTAPLDARLRDKYLSAFDLVDPHRSSGVPVPPAGLPPSFKKMWTIGVIILCDQISRNVFRGSARAYATDALARRLIAPLLEEFGLLPVPVRVTIILVLIHSENMADWGLAAIASGQPPTDLIAAHLALVKPELENDCDFVFQSLRRISINHRDRMIMFGRVPERNAFLGRDSSEQEVAFMRAIDG
jgi:uncharacterized protein (DUF924 family)